MGSYNMRDGKTGDKGSREGADKTVGGPVKMEGTSLNVSKHEDIDTTKQHLNTFGRWKVTTYATHRSELLALHKFLSESRKI